MSCDLPGLSQLKEYTRELIDDSKIKHDEGDDDYIDWTIIPFIERINENPRLVTTGSCSGHNGYPFIGLVFNDDKAKNHYVYALRKLGLSVFKSDEFRLSYFDVNFPTANITEEYFAGPRRKLTRDESRKLWQELAEILSI